MNKIIKISICITVALATVSCDKFLTEDPKTNIFEAKIYEDEVNAATAVSGCYIQFTQLDYYGVGWVRTPAQNSMYVTNGVAITQSGAGNVNQLQIGWWKYDTHNDAIDRMFRGVYVAVRTCNETIYGIVNSPISEEAKNRLVAEVKFLRGICYFNIVRTYGRAPFYLTPPTTMEEAHRPKSDVNVIFDAVIEDFEFAAQYMLQKNDSRRIPSRPFNYAAKAMLAQVYAHLATSQYLFLDVVDPYSDEDREEFWHKAYAYAKEVWDAKVYTLYPDYQKLWRTQTRNTEEAIFEIQFNLDTPRNEWSHDCIPGQSTFTPVATTTNNGGQMRPSKVMYEWHKEKYSSYNEGTGELMSRDPRIAANYIVNEYFRSQMHNNPGARVRIYPDLAENPANPPDAARFPGIIKYCDPYWRSGNASNINWPFYRYSALLLLLAECANEIGDPDGIKFTVVNEVLTRARNSSTLQPAKNTDIEPPLSVFIPTTEPADWDPSDARYANKDLFRKEVLKERLFELPMEGHEWHDVRRRGIEWFIGLAEEFNEAQEKYALPSERVGQNGPWDDDVIAKLIVKAPTDPNEVRKFLLFPFPFDELNENKALTLQDQNYGYSQAEASEEEDDDDE